MSDDFLQILQEHIRRYPFMESQDFGKLAYQSEFGPEEKLKQIEGMEISGMRECLKECADYFDVLLEIYRLMEKGNPVVVAIDGRCGSGKTHLAKLIGKLFPCNVLHMDDFYLPFDQRPDNWRELPAGNMDLERFLTEVLRPVKLNKQTFYRPYSCSANRMEEAVQLMPHKLTVVEGSYSHHPLLAAEYDLTIFLTCTKEEQRKRLQIREGDYFPAFETQWIPMEENYLRQHSIEENSHLVVDTGRFFAV